MNDARTWTHAALFGALWGALELSIGTVLQLSKLPMRGTIMAAMGLVCLFTLKRLQPQTGVCLLAGFVAIILKIVTLGGFILGPLIGIGMEAIAVETAFLLVKHRKLAATMAGAFALASHPVQRVLMTSIMAGPEVVEAMLRGLASGFTKLGLPIPSFGLLAASILGFWLLIGVIIGLWAWGIAERVAQRIGVP